MIEDGANCTLSVRNTAGTSYNPFDNDPIWYVDYTLFHGDQTSIGNNQIAILSEQSDKKGSVNFQRIRICFLDKLSEYVTTTTVYTNTEPSNEAIDWMMRDITENSQCDDPFFIERHALVALLISVATDSLQEIDELSKTLTGEPVLSTRRQCVWPHVGCSAGSVISLSLSSFSKLIAWKNN